MTGQERAPEVLRSLNLEKRLRDAGVDCVDAGDLPLVRYVPDTVHRNCQNLPLTTAFARQLADRVEAEANDGRRPLVIGGDCTVALGILAGLRRREPSIGLLYVDGDIDMNTPDDSPSGILDGMVLAHVTGRVDNELSRIGRSLPLVAEEKIVAFGYNVDAGWIDPGELQRFEKSAIHKVSAREIRESPAASAERALGIVDSRVESWLLHFDVDVVDASEFPAADVPHEKGISISDVATALSVFWASPRCAGLVVTELNPDRDPDRIHATRLVELIVATLA